MECGGHRPLNESTGIGRGYFVRHLRMLSTIKFRYMAPRLVCTNPTVSATGLVDADEATETF